MCKVVTKISAPRAEQHAKKTVLRKQGSKLSKFNRHQGYSPLCPLRCGIAWPSDLMVWWAFAAFFFRMASFSAGFLNSFANTRGRCSIRAWGAQLHVRVALHATVIVTAEVAGANFVLEIGGFDLRAPNWCAVLRFFLNNRRPMITDESRSPS